MDRRFLAASRFSHSWTSRGISFIRRAAMVNLQYHFGIIILPLSSTVNPAGFSFLSPCSSRPRFAEGGMPCPQRSHQGQFMNRPYNNGVWSVQFRPELNEINYFTPHPPLPLKRLCRNPFMVRQAHHERIMSALKFSNLAVRPEPVEGRPGDYDAVPRGED